MEQIAQASNLDRTDLSYEVFIVGLGHRLRRRGSPRLPWKRGPAAWEIALRADEILHELAGCSRRFLSLRRTARLLGVSTQPLRDWTRRGHIKRDGPRRQFGRVEICRFVGWLAQCAEPYDMSRRVERLHRKNDRPRYRFAKLRSLRGSWPKGQKTLTPKEFAQFAGCHPSLVVKAIHEDELRARRRSACRWEIPKCLWNWR
jgi:hypothetical protein